MSLVTAEFLYAGLPDYWGGNGDRWDDDKGCIFAPYGKDTLVRDIVQGAVNDFITGGDCDTLHKDVNCGDIREALLACLTDEGRKDYHNGGVSEFSIDYAEANNLNCCRDCGESMGDEHEEGCELLTDYAEFGDDDDIVVFDDCNGDDCDSPIVVFIIKTEVCSECGVLDEHYTDELCEACAKKHGYEV